MFTLYHIAIYCVCGLFTVAWFAGTSFALNRKFTNLDCLIEFLFWPLELCMLLFRLVMLLAYTCVRRVSGMQ